MLTGLSPASLQVPLQADQADSNIRVPLISNHYDRGLVPGVLADLHLQVVTASCVPSLERDYCSEATTSNSKSPKSSCAEADAVWLSAVAPHTYPPLTCLASQLGMRHSSRSMGFQCTLALGLLTAVRCTAQQQAVKVRHSSGGHTLSENRRSARDQVDMSSLSDLRQQP